MKKTNGTNVPKGQKNQMGREEERRQRKERRGGLSEGRQLMKETVEEEKSEGTERNETDG